jgi:protein required for attachment to host cells
MKAPTTWLVVADAGGARVFEVGANGALERTPRTTLEADAAPSREIASDRPGRTFDIVGNGRHAKAPPTDPHRYEKKRFAHTLAERLESAVARREVERLVVAAPPQLMGDLRAAMASGAKDAVATEIAKDLTKLPPHDLERHLADELRAAVASIQS